MPLTSNQFVTIRRIAIAAAVLFVAAAAVAFVWFPPRNLPPANSVLVIVPYRYANTWVFDDEAAGLKREPFVSGVPEMIDLLVAKIPHADKGFRLTFSAIEFPGYQKKLTWLRGDRAGNWYRLDDPPMEGWLCPALFRYYAEAPKALYVKADPKE